MKEIASGVYYCGLHDKNRKLFDQLVPLPQGTTYNSYLVKGAQKCALIDTMYEKLLDPYRDMLRRAALKSIISYQTTPSPIIAARYRLSWKPFRRRLCYAPPNARRTCRICSGWIRPE